MSPAPNAPTPQGLSLVFEGLRLVPEDRQTRLAVRNGIVVSIGGVAPADLPRAVLPGTLAFPGLINSHDHLPFNLYPSLGEGPYPDYVAWGLDIQERHRDLIQSIEAIPEETRRRIGAWKNLLRGVTTVVDHMPWRRRFVDGLHCVSPFLYLHSTRFHRRWRWRLNRFPRHLDAVAHLGEGVSDLAAREVRAYLRWNLRRRQTVAVHGLAIKPEQASRFRALVWCPVSNFFLYNATADLARLKGRVPILFGSDASLTANPSIWRHLRFARDLGALSDRELFDAVSGSAAAVWRLPGCGAIQVGKPANFVLARAKRASMWDSFYDLSAADILLAVRDGRPLAIDDALCRGNEVLGRWAASMHPWNGDGRTKRLAADLAALTRRVRDHRGAQFPFAYDRGEPNSSS